MSARYISLATRFDLEEYALMQAVAQEAHLTITEYIRRATVEDAETRILDRRLVSSPVTAWDTFQAWADTDPAAEPMVGRMASMGATWTP